MSTQPIRKTLRKSGAVPKIPVPPPRLPASAKNIPVKKPAAVVKTAEQPREKAASKPMSVVTLKQLAANLSKVHEDIPTRQVEELLDDTFELISNYVARGVKLRVTGFGVLQARARAARMGRNPATGESIAIPASKKIAFKPAKEFKTLVTES